jgi:acyl-CoA synthetase (AMP-forming)/AMP-acid ligase II
MVKSPLFNIANYLPETAEKYPDKKAVIFSKVKKKFGKKASFMTFDDLNRECDRYAYGLSGEGIKMGMKVLLMVRPSPEFIALTFALFKMGAVPVLIDPGMGVNRLLDCIKDVQPDAVVGIPAAHIVRILTPGYFKSVKINIVVGPDLFFLGKSLEKISSLISKPYVSADTHYSSPAAILFTSGSTGPAKGVMYEHGMFSAQVDLLRKVYDFKPGEVDLSGLPVFALFDVAFSMTCVVPDMDPARPAKVNPEKIVQAVKKYNVTTSFGSPAIWERVSSYCKDNNIKLLSVKRILMAGAPVPGELISITKKIIPEGEVYTPYGATESLPISSISGSEILNETYEGTRKGKGICVGHPVTGVTVKIIKIVDGIISKLSEDIFVPTGEVGEIIVKGPSVTKAYYLKEEATWNSKIIDERVVWHRIGDVGYIDVLGRIWFCGRKDHRVITEKETIFTIPVEAVFNCHKNVFRSALVGTGEKGKQKAVIIIEPEKGYFPVSEQAKDKFKSELLKLSSDYPHCQMISDVLFYKSFPVDIRHNAKIYREKLAQWAAERVK